MMTQVDKPALLRQLFDLGCVYSGQILSYQKMLGQLQDAGNTTTLAHYLQLLEQAGLLAGLRKFSGGKVRRRASSPKLLALNTGLMTAAHRISYEEALRQKGFWGRLVESAVGAALYNGLVEMGADIHYWAGRNREVDYVISRNREIVAIEVKSGSRRASLPGIAEFSKQFQVKKKLLIGGDGISIEEFLASRMQTWLD
jgi:predicted AAA+ superfamily ATPase